MAADTDIFAVNNFARGVRSRRTCAPHCPRSDLVSSEKLRGKEHEMKETSKPTCRLGKASMCSGYSESSLPKAWRREA